MNNNEMLKKIKKSEKDIVQINEQLDNKAYKTFVTVDEFKNGFTDTGALQNALNSGFSVVDGGNKTYTITSEVSIPSNVELRNITLLRGFTGGTVLRNKENEKNIILDNVSIKHNENDSTALLLYKTENVVVKNCYISTKTGFSIQLEVAKNINIFNTKIDNIQKEDFSLNYTDGIHIYGGCSNIFIDNCNIKAGDDGIGISNEYEKDNQYSTYNTIENIYISNCYIDTNARMFCITCGKTRTSKSYFKNIHFTNITSLCHGSIFIKKEIEELEAEIEGIILDNVILKPKFKGVISQHCYFENIKNSYIKNSLFSTKGTVEFKNCEGIKVINVNIDTKNTAKEVVISYEKVVNSYFNNITITGNNTNINNLTACKNNIFENYKMSENATNRANAFVGTGEGNIFKNFVLRGSNLIDFSISSTTFLNNIIDGFVYFKSKEASNLSTKNTVGSKIRFDE